MNGSNPTRHVIVALTLAAIIAVLAGDKLDTRMKDAPIKKFLVPVRPVGIGGK